MKQRTKPEDYRPGETCVYHEGPLVVVVKILSVAEVERYISFELETIWTVWCPTTVAVKSPGNLFTVSLHRDVPSASGWYFREYTEAYAQQK